MKPLFEAKAASQRDYDEAISADEVAAADVKSAKARLVEATALEAERRDDDRHRATA